MIGQCLENVRIKKPLIHNITNYVTVNDVANVILACGASPIMADEVKEVEEISALCQGLNINIGTLNYRTIEGMYKAGKVNYQLGHPMLLDPVGAGASELRTKTAIELMTNLKFNVIKGNISEIKTLAFGKGNTQGVDANVLDQITDDNLDDAIVFVKDFSKRCGSIIAVTGKIDLISNGDVCYVVRNGHEKMERITGSGCQLSGMITAFLAANPSSPLEATLAAVCSMGLAGEIALNYLKEYEGNATYRLRIIDAIDQMTGEQLEEGAKYEIR